MPFNPLEPGAGDMASAQEMFAGRYGVQLEKLAADANSQTEALEKTLCEFAVKAEEEEAWVEARLEELRSGGGSMQPKLPEEEHAEDLREADAQRLLKNALVENAIFVDIGPGWKR
mmetsp:Transcript_20259/g.59738  ORF Transcript_20259/g.59738 Transcript_20259/m.59738 type:complete len:116 (+) Transcript_20259:43-390(+)